jgi:hypothetical protein
MILRAIFLLLFIGSVIEDERQISKTVPRIARIAIRNQVKNATSFLLAAGLLDQAPDPFGGQRQLVRFDAEAR